MRSMFPHVPTAAIHYDLQKTGSVEQTCDNILRDGSLPMVTYYFQHQMITNATDKKVLIYSFIRSSLPLPAHLLHPLQRLLRPQLQDPASPTETLYSDSSCRRQPKRIMFLKSPPKSGVIVPKSVRRSLRVARSLWFSRPESKSWWGIDI